MSLIRVITRISPVDPIPDGLLTPGDFGSPTCVETRCVTDPRSGFRYTMETTFFTEALSGPPGDAEREISTRFPGLVCASGWSTRDDVAPVLGDDCCGAEACAALKVPERIPREEVPKLLNNLEREECGLKIRFNLKKIAKFRRDSKHRHSEKRARTRLLRPLLRYFVDDECLICGFLLTSTLRENIVHHMTSHIESTSYKCPECGVSTEHVREFYLHSIGHEITTPYPCSKCDKKFDRKHFLTVHHLKEHSESSLSMPFLSRWDASVLRQNIPPRFVCSDCRARFSSHVQVIAHRKVHSGRYQCLFCGKSFASDCLLRYHSHIRIISRKRHVCKTCGMSFVSRREFVQHKNSRHKKQVQYPCEVCGKKFNFRKNLSKHSKTVHLKLIGVP